jgi:hypothetical protein
MTKDEVLQQVADQYRSEGYCVTMTTGVESLPNEVPHLPKHVALIAQKNGESVAVEVMRRDQLYGIDLKEMGASQHLPGWRFDLVVYPPGGVDGIPLEDGEPSPEYVESLLTEAQQLLDLGKPRAAFLVAWSAVETTMRTAARREDLEIEEGIPQFVLTTLYTDGPISNEDYERVGRSLKDRNRLMHGLAVDRLEPDEIRFLIDFARQLLYGTVAADA